MKYNLSPHHPKVVQAAIEMVRQMTPEEALAFFTYRTPGVEETDMTGMYGNGQKPKKTVGTKQRPLDSKAEMISNPPPYVNYPRNPSDEDVLAKHAETEET